VEQICNRVVVISKGKILADAPPAELTRVMKLTSLESAFAQVVQQQDTRPVARELVEIIKVKDV
jgi:ABC-2 type transport system ATP-binding protein